MSLHPKVPKDFALAPVAVAVDLNLALYRDKPAEQLVQALELALNQSVTDGTPADRAQRVLTAALRGVNLHEWQAGLTPDLARIRLSGGSVSLDVGLSRTLQRFIDGQE